jgi:hypothetical protein
MSYNKLGNLQAAIRKHIFLHRVISKVFVSKNYCSYFARNPLAHLVRTIFKDPIPILFVRLGYETIKGHRYVYKNFCHIIK